MIALSSQKGHTLIVMGLGGSGLATAEALRAGGAHVLAWDDNEAARARAVAAGFAVRAIQDADFDACHGLVLAPGIPLHFPEPHWSVQQARAHRKPVFGDIELFSRERDVLAPAAPLIAITGTNGKSTTTALIAHILRTSGRDTQMGGNIGTAILSLAPPAVGRFHVVECSSYQIDLAPSVRPSVGILLNITPDHIDRHGTLDNYALAKLRLIANVPAQETKIIGIDDDHCLKFCRQFTDLGHKVEAVSISRPVTNGLYAEGGEIVRMKAGHEVVRFSLEGLGALRGAHNAQNAMAAYAACEASGLGHDEIMAGLRSFGGLAHRMEQVGRRGNVLFINDSKATNADSAEKALLSYEDIFWIAGGRPKEGGIQSLAHLLPKIRKTYLIGEAAPAFARTLGAHAHDQVGTLDRAVTMAAEEAARLGASQAVVLLSPACASFDQFANFEARGDHFRALVLALDGIEPVKG